MKPIMQRIAAFACRNFIDQSLTDKEKFHWWLTTIGSKHCAAIIEIDQGLRTLFENQPTSDAYTKKLMQFIYDDNAGPLKEFLNTHPKIEKFLSDHFNVIEKAAIDFIVDNCVIELNKNIDYRIVDQIKAQQKENPHLLPAEIKIAPLRTGVKKEIESESHSKISRISLIATDKVIFCLEAMQKTPFSLEQLSAIGARLVVLNQRSFLDRFIKIILLLAKDNEMVDWICSQCQLFDFKSDTPDHYEFIERCITIQLPLLSHCSNEVLENFSATLIRFSTLSFYEDLFAESHESPEATLSSQTQLMDCWKFIYRQLQLKTELKATECIQQLIANLEVFLVDIKDDLQETAEPVAAEDDGYNTQSESAPSSQDVPPVEEYNDSNNGVSSAICILNNAAASDSSRSELTRQHSATRAHWSRHNSLYHDNRKRAYSSTIPTQQPTADVPQTINRKMT